MKSYAFDEALEILADVLERDGKKSRRAKKDRRALEHNAVRLSRVVKKLGRALGASLVWSESTAAGQVVPGSSDLLRPVEDGANS